MWKYLFNSENQIYKSGYEFKMVYPFDKRKTDSTRLIKSSPGKIPIIIERADFSQLKILEDKKIQRLIIPRDFLLGQLLYFIRKNLKLDSSKTIFLIINNNIIPQTTATLGEIYDKYADPDGFLYITFSDEQIFG